MNTEKTHKTGTTGRTLAAFATVVVIIICSCTKQSLETTFNNQDTKIDTYAESVNFYVRELTLTATDDGDGNYSMQTTDTIVPRVTRNGGVTRLSIIEGDGPQLTSKGTVNFHYAGFVFSSGPTSIQLSYLTIADTTGTEHTSWLFSTPYSTINASGKASTGAVISGSGSSSGLTMFGTNHYLTAMFTGWNFEEGDDDALKVSLNDNSVIEGLRKGLEGVREGEVCDIVFSGRYGLGKRDKGAVTSNSALLYRVWVDSISN
ncbi:MAG: FKBP-type peptidyl-prolyl cis-trans isomerase [Bacteroidales bacterium]|nr:FKBP-type peptidyl-prolyl cis-trans isomerase [Bacteroidales bacterium]